MLHIFRCFYVGPINVYWVYILLLDCPLYHYGVFFFVSYYSLGFKVYFCRIEVLLPQLFIPFHSHELFFSIPLLWVCVYLSIWGGSLESSIYIGIVFLSTQLPYVFWLEHLSHLHLRWLLSDIYLLSFYSLIIFLCFFPFSSSFSLLYISFYLAMWHKHFICQYIYTIYCSFGGLHNISLMFLFNQCPH